MRIRALDANGDMTFGNGAANFLIDSPAAVAQSVMTRLKLLKGEWFLDLSEGADWQGQILGHHTTATRDFELRRVILETPGVAAITDYASALDPVARAYAVSATISTAYGSTTITATV